MAKVRADEVLGKAVDTDSVAVPRYDLVAPDGTVVATNVALTLKNPIVQRGMNVDKVAMDECLAASGLAGGTKKALTLSQENFALFDGALVRFQLFDMLSGAATLNINNTGAKRIKTSSGEDPDGFVAGTWVDAIYSAVRDQYILMGGGGGSAALSQTVNLLEEVIDMKYCKVLTTQAVNIDLNAEWLSMGILKATCETENYKWYMRIRQGSTLYEFRKVHKTTGAVEEFSATANFSWMPQIQLNTGTSSYAQPRYMHIQLTPVRNGDAVLWAACARCHAWPNSTEYYWTDIAWGIVFPDNYVYIRYQQDAHSDRDGNYDPSYFPFNTINGYYDVENQRIICAMPAEYASSSLYRGPYATPSHLISFNVTTHALVWDYTDGTSSGSAQYGRYIWVIDGSNAVGFPIYRHNTETSYGQSVPYCFRLSFTATAAPTTATAVGENLSFPCGPVQIIPSPCTGWVLEPERNTITLLCSYCQNAPGSNDSAGSYANTFTYNYVEKTASYKGYKLSSNSENYQYACCIPGYINKKAFLMLPQAYSDSTASVFALLYELETHATQAVPACGLLTVNNSRTYGYSDAVTNYTWGGIVGPGMIAASFTGASGLVVDQTNQVSTIVFAATTDGAIIKWICPEDGIYKFIAVGGGAEGSGSYGGGAGYLQLATAQLTTGDIVCCKIGTGGVVVQQSAYDVLHLKSKAQATYAYLENDPTATPLVFAMPASGNQGGATGAATPSGGGAGGYDLVQYGGQGMNFCSTGSTTVIALSKDRNGGVSANAGACTSGDGYGAGGAMNQNGKDGCLVIIR